MSKKMNSVKNQPNKFNSNFNTKVYNNIYLSPNKNLNFNYSNDEEGKNYKSNNYNYKTIHTEESKNEIRSSSYNKTKPGIFPF